MTELIAVRLPQVADQLAAIDEVWARGDAVLPIDPTLSDAGVAELLAQMRPDGIVLPRPDGVVRVRRVPNGVPVTDGTALVVTTSGSTGEPKGVVLDHASLAASTSASLERLGCAPGERWLLCLPLSHVAGIQVLLRSRRLGTEPVVLEGFDVDAVARAVASGEVGHVSLVPTQLVRLLDAGVDLSPLHGVLLGGAPPGEELLARAAEAGVAVTVSYGMSETCGGCVYDGVPLGGVAVAQEAGRLAFRGAVLTRGYRRAGGELDPSPVDGGWFVSSDLGEVENDGRVVVHGRADDVVITGGENVPLGMVEAALQALPGVTAAAAVARPHPEWGQEIVAVAAFAPGHDRSLGELRAELTDPLPRHARPRSLVVVEALPLTSLGKPDRRALQALAEAADRG